ncbi:hypothetical protein V5H41_29185, partial [Salmonella enterica]
DGKLDEKTSEWDERASLGVVIAAGGYPGNYNTVDLCLAACDGKLDEKTSEWDERASLGVVIAAGGYPGNYNT